jgi:hypothetical protein
MDHGASQTVQLVSQPLRCPATISGMLGKGAHAGDGKKFGKLPEKPVLFSGHEIDVHKRVSLTRVGGNPSTSYTGNSAGREGSQ